ncbi:MAG: hypothetical protein JSV54_03080 [Chloroflexota bacterium]|nr:MAG: hypothetical protein JSV54_03080 [Chloroflexota bacterium]
MDSVVYEESPRYDSLFKGILALPVFFILFGIYYLYIGEVEGAIGMFATTLLMFAVFWAIFPRRYQIFDSKFRIALGGPFSFTVPFSNLEAARMPEGATFGINFPTCFSNERTVQIIRKKGWYVNITPTDRDLFLENLNKALADWRRSSKQ